MVDCISQLLNSPSLRVPENAGVLLQDEVLHGKDMDRDLGDPVPLHLEEERNLQGAVHWFQKEETSETSRVKQTLTNMEILLNNVDFCQPLEDIALEKPQLKDVGQRTPMAEKIAALYKEDPDKCIAKWNTVVLQVHQDDICPDGKLNSRRLLNHLERHYPEYMFVNYVRDPSRKDTSINRMYMPLVLATMNMNMVVQCYEMTGKKDQKAAFFFVGYHAPVKAGPVRFVVEALCKHSPGAKKRTADDEAGNRTKKIILGAAVAGVAVAGAAFAVANPGVAANSFVTGLKIVLSTPLCLAAPLCDLKTVQRLEPISLVVFSAAAALSTFSWWS